MCGDVLLAEILDEGGFDVGEGVEDLLFAEGGGFEFDAEGGEVVEGGEGFAGGDEGAGADAADAEDAVEGGAEGAVADAGLEGFDESFGLAEGGFAFLEGCGGDGLAFDEFFGAVVGGFAFVVDGAGGFEVGAEFVGAHAEEDLVFGDAVAVVEKDFFGEFGDVGLEVDGFAGEGGAEGFEGVTERFALIDAGDDDGEGGRGAAGGLGGGGQGEESGESYKEQGVVFFEKLHAFT